MKRSYKNIIMISIIIIMMIGILLTMKSVNNSSSNMPNINRTPPNMPNGTPPSMPNGTPPEMNNEEVVSNTKNEMTNGDISNRKNRKEDSNRQFDKQNGDRRNFGDVAPPSMPNEMFDTNNNATLSTMHYVIFTVDSLVIATILMYLFMSNFNKKTFKETFQESDKVIITILSVIILTSAFTYIDILLTNRFFLNDNISNNRDNMPSGNSSNNITYSASKEITSNETITSGTFTSSNVDENAISVSGDIEVTLSNIEVSKTGDSNGGDSTSFYGTNSSILAKDGATLNISNSKITTNATGANGVFSYGGSATTNNSNSDGTTINISDSKITTTANNAGGIMATGGGIMNANNLEIITSGTSSAAIRSDRGGGKVTVNKGTYKTSGQGSPAIYSTADITVNDATLISTASEGVVIEGANSVTLNNCELTDTNNKLNGQSTTYKNIFLYQSMSGDAKSGNAIFTSNNSKITTNNGDSFYITNTTATINLTNNTIINNDSTGNFLRIKADSWGTSGSNGGDVTMNMINQKVMGNIVVDNISTLNMTMKENSSFEGVINGDNNAKEITLTIDSTSKIKLMGDSYVTSLNDVDTTYSNIDFNGYKLYVNNKAIN